MDLPGIVTDLYAEGSELESMVRELPEAHWSRDTPAHGWTIAHQIAHLAWTDEVALLAITDPETFRAQKAQLATLVDAQADAGAAQAPTQLLERWRGARSALAQALLACPAGSRLAWIGPPMSVASMASARLMETWAHGQDVADALGLLRRPTQRLRHVADLGVRTRDYAFERNGRRPPPEPFRVELVAPSGQTWTWGPASADQRVSGPALDFCLRVTQRRGREQLDLVATGVQARQWLEIAQAFAGSPAPSSGGPA